MKTNELIKIKPGVPQKMDAADKPDFETWMKRVDAVLIRCVGFSSADLPDCNFSSWYESRLRPIRAAKRALKNASE